MVPFWFLGDKKQSTDSKNATEAEYCGCFLDSVDAISSYDLHIQQVQVTSLFCDSKSAIYIAENPVFHDRTKHLNRIVIL